METVDFEVNEMYSKVFQWFYSNFKEHLIISESESIVKFVSKHQDDNIIQMFRYEYDVLVSSDQLKELKELIKTIK